VVDTFVTGPVPGLQVFRFVFDSEVRVWLVSSSSLVDVRVCKVRRRPVVLAELNAVEQRLKAVLEVLDGASVTDVARRYEVTRQSVHNWLRHHSVDGFKGLVDRPSRPLSCPHQMRPRWKR
jgi:hypothetical protein